MKLAIPGEGNTLDAALCPQFGRAPYFCLYDTEKGTTVFAENAAAAGTGGAGIEAAQFLADNDVAALIAMRCGANAAKVLHAAGIELWKAKGLSIADNVDAFEQGTLERLTTVGEGMHRHA